MHTICVVCILLKYEYFVWVVKELWQDSVCVCVCLRIVQCRVGIWLSVCQYNQSKCFGPQWIEKVSVWHEDVSAGTENQYSDFIKNGHA